MIKKLISLTLVILHIFTFGYVADGFAALAQSASYKLDAAVYSYGTPNKTSSTYKLALDSTGESSIGLSASANYKLNAGYIYVAQSNAPQQIQTIPNFSWQENESLFDAFNLDNYFSSPDSLPMTYTVSRSPGSTNNINVSIAPSDTKMLLHCDGAQGSTNFIDDKGHAVTVNGNTKIDTAQAKFSGASAYFDGSGDYLSLADINDWYFGTGDFTADLWVRFQTLPSDGSWKYLFTQRADDNNRQRLYVSNNSGVYSLRYNVMSGGVYKITLTRDYAFAVDTWYHLAITRSGNKFRMFINGQQQGSTVTNSNEVPDFPASFYIGQKGDGGLCFKGWMDEIRIVKGRAVWTANFTPPEAPYTSTGSSDKVVSFSQPQAWYGTETVIFTATDSESNSVTSNPVSLQVEGVDNPPVLDFIADVTVDETQLVKITPHATDLDGDTITYTFTTPLDANGEWQTDYTSAGTRAVTVTATDSSSLHLTDTQDVTITVTNVNRAPVITQINGIAVTPGVTLTLPNVAENTTLEITPTATDADNETILYSYSSPIDSSGTWLIDYNQAGTHTFTVSAFDGIDPVTQQVQVNVLNVNRAPVATLTLSKYTLDPNETFTVNLTATDPDSDSMTYVLKKDNVTFSSGAIIDTITENTSFSTEGDHTVSCIVTDSGALEATILVDVDVPGNSNRDSINPVMGDFNGDALSDLGFHNSDTGTWEVALSNKGVFTAALDWLTGFGTSKDWWPIGGDFNGDGLTDIGIYNNTTGELKVALSDGTKFNIQDTWLTFGGASYSWIPLTGNFNGDKYTDFGLYNKDTGEWKIAKGTGTGFGSFTPWLSGFGGSDYSPLTGDFNADGLTDIAIFKKSSGEFKVAFSNTLIFIAQPTTWATGYATDKDPIIADFNNDGLTDVGYFDKSQGKWFYALNTTTAFTGAGEWLTGFGSSSDESGHTGDFNGDGLTDAATFDKDQTGINRWAVRLSTKKPVDLLVEIDNGIGGKTEITYDYAATLNNELLPFPVYVAKSISSINTFPTDRAATYTQLFTYEGGWFDAEEREFRGFRMIKAKDSITGNYTETYFYQGKPPEDGALKGQIEKILAYDGTGKLISQAVNTWDVRKAGPTDGVLGFPYLKEVTQTVYEYGATSPVSTKNQFSYDNVGNITQEICLGDITLTGDEKSTETKYLLPYAQGHNRPKEILLKDKDGIVVNKKIFEYYSEGNLKKETAYLDGVNDPSTQYDYDSFGNVTLTTNAENHTVTTDYETTLYTYPETITNELGHTIKYEYNTKFGAVTKLTDVNNHTTETVYDTLARITAQKNTQSQTVTTYSYPDFNTKITISHCEAQSAEAISKTEYIDGLGRAYKSVSDGEDGASKVDVITEVYFNSRGLKDHEDLPHYAGETPSTIKYEYDLRGRLHKTIAFPGTISEATTTINYLEPLYTENIDPKGAIKRVRKDVYGNTRVIEEHVRNQYPGVEAGIFLTTYEYDLKGNLTKLTDSKGNITQIQYDTLGRKILLNDPDTGITTYTYDKLGNLKTQTDNKGNVITMEYDCLSRLIAKKGLSPQGTVPVTLATYDYDDTSKSNCRGRLSKITDQNGNINSYYYDTEGRTFKVEKTIDSTTYVTQTAYDLIGRTTSITYPGGTIVYYLYDQNSGLLEAVSDTTEISEGTAVSDTAYVKRITYNAKGQIKTIKYGNSTQTTYNYGQDLRLSRIFTQNASSQTLQDLNYTFDDNGNIIQLVDNLRSNIRTYEYDDLNRLVWARNTPNPSGGYTDFNYNYNSIGNMTYKSDVGFMTYGEGRGLSPQGTVPITAPHAVTTAGSNLYTYDPNGNMFSAPNKLMAYDVENRMISLETSAGITQFVYDSSETRIKKITPNETTTYVSSLYEVRVTAQGLRIIKHVFAGANKICTIDSVDGARYIHSDHLGSSNVITDETGAQVSLTEYTPYGTIAKQEGSFSTPYKFTGKELDTTGMYYYGARYYDPTIAKFTQPDSTIQAPFDPQTLNRYSYCRNNPLIYTDPTGHFFGIDDLIIGAIIGAIIGGVCAAVTGGNVAHGFLSGAISGAIFGAIGGMNFEGFARTAAHTIGGSASGAITSFIEGEDVGRGALIGGLSAGGNQWLGNNVDFLKPVAGRGAGAYLANVSRRAAIGGLIGGGVSVATGGDFWQGAEQGALTSAIAYSTNDWLHRVFEGSRYGGGSGGKAKAKLGPVKVEFSMNDISGKIVTTEGFEDFSEQKTEASLEVFHVKLSYGYSNGKSQLTPSLEFEKFSIANFTTIEVGGTSPTPSGASYDLELQLHLDKLFDFRR